MNKLNQELKRLYQGAPEGETRSIALAFRRLPDDGEAGHWERLCTVANALQAELGMPAPAVSIDGAGAYGLWLSLANPVPVTREQEFVRRLCAAYCPGLEGHAAAGEPTSQLALPPRLDPARGKWAAFINPGMGASFAGDEGLEMQPPEAGQLALLEGLESASAAQFAQAMERLRPAGGGSPRRQTEGLLLKDATLEDIVSFLHSKNIEPTFRFLK